MHQSLIRVFFFLAKLFPRKVQISPTQNQPPFHFVMLSSTNLTKIQLYTRIENRVISVHKNILKNILIIIHYDTVDSRSFEVPREVEIYFE